MSMGMNYLPQRGLRSPRLRRAIFLWATPALAFSLVICAWQIPGILSDRANLAMKQESATHAPVVFDERPGLEQRIALQENVLAQLYLDRSALTNSLVPLVRLINVLPSNLRLSQATLAGPNQVVATVETDSTDGMAGAARLLLKNGVTVTTGSYTIGPPLVFTGVTFALSDSLAATPPPAVLLPPPPRLVPHRARTAPSGLAPHGAHAPGVPALAPRAPPHSTLPHLHQTSGSSVIQNAHPAAHPRNTHTS